MNSTHLAKSNLLDVRLVVQSIVTMGLRVLVAKRSAFVITFVYDIYLMRLCDVIRLIIVCAWQPLMNVHLLILQDEETIIPSLLKCIVISSIHPSVHLVETSMFLKNHGSIKPVYNYTVAECCFCIA